MAIRGRSTVQGHLFSMSGSLLEPWPWGISRLRSYRYTQQLT